MNIQLYNKREEADIMTKIFLICFLSIFSFVSSEETFNSNMKSFSFSKKELRTVSGKEEIIFAHESAGPAVLTEQWFASGICVYEETIVNYYMDGSVTPTISVNLMTMHGMGYYNQTQKPWGTKRIGFLAENGGLYNTIRFPFQKSIRITFLTKGDCIFWFIVRGVENYPIVIGDIQLPSNAQLVLHKHENLTLKPYELISFANSARNGILFMVTLAAQSTDFNYLEGCFRLVGSNGSKTQFLSSGTEDFFLSAYYYNKGLYYSDHAGLTYLEKPGTMSAYKFFELDPVIFNKDLNLVWSCGESKNSGCFAGSENCFVDQKKVFCFSSKEVFNERSVQYADTVITSYVWTYEW